MKLSDPLFIIPASTGLIFIIAGVFVLWFPPKTINGLYGYRTPNSMKSQARWDFAQHYSAKEMIKTGAILILTSILSFFYHPSVNIAVGLSLGIMVALVTIMIIKTEIAIKKKFKQN